MKIQNILSSLSLIDEGLKLKDGRFSGIIGIVHLHPSKGKHCVAYIIENYFDSYGCSPPQELSMFNIKRNGHCVFSEYKKQGLKSKEILIVRPIVFIKFT